MSGEAERSYDADAPVPGREAGRVRGVVRAGRRITAAPLLVRAVVWGTGFAIVVLAVPPGFWDVWLAVLAVVLAAVTAILPGSRWVAGVESFAVLVWFGTTMVTRYPIPPVHLLALATALYLHHSWAARAAVLPLDAAVDVRVLRGWLLRSVGVLAVALPWGLLVPVLPAVLGRTDLMILPLLGIVALLAAGYGLFRLARQAR